MGNTSGLSVDQVLALLEKIQGGGRPPVGGQGGIGDTGFYGPDIAAYSTGGMQTKLAGSPPPAQPRSARDA